jgi:ribosomal protein L37AE/L43A
MCFRPTGTAAKPIECPECGRKIPIVLAMKTKKCPQCGLELTEENTKPKEPPKD